MMKIIGIVTMMISSILYGLSFYRKYKARPDDIDLFINLINKYMVELKWKRKSIFDIIEQLEEFDYFKEIKVLSKDNSLIDSAITLNSKFKNLFLTKEDVAILQYFFENSGKSNLENELALCEKTLEQLKNQKEDAQVTMKKFGPLSVKFCLILAVWIAIMFI